jgi:capsular polysaccharide transport system permease protein
MSATGWGDRHADGDPGEGRSTLVGLRVQLRVIHALLLREMDTRFGRNQLGFLWMFLEPLLFAAGISLLRTLLGTGHGVPGVHPFIFGIVSYLPFFTFRSVLARAPGTLRSNLPLLYHSQIKLLDVVLARHALEMAALIVIMTVLVMGIAFWGDMPPYSVPVLLIGLLLVFGFAHGCGLIAAAVASVFPVWQRLLPVLVFITMPLSGAMIALHMLDPSLRELLLWNPQAHMHEMVRHGVFGDRIKCYFDIGYAAFWVTVANLLGLAALRAVRPKLQV